MTPEEAAEAPALTAAPQPQPALNPVIDDSNIKAMSAKFRELTKREPQTTPNPLPEMRTEKPAKAAEAPATQPATPAAPATAAPTEPEPPPLDERTLSSAARENFKRLTQSNAEFRKQVEEGRKALEGYQTKLNELEAETGKYRSLGVNPDEFNKTKKELERLAKENEQMLSQIETVNLERSPRFQNWWKNETEKHLKIAQRLVPADKREIVAKLLMEPPSAARDTALDEIIEPLTPTSKRIVTGALESLEAVKMQREEALTQGSERWRQLQAVEQAERAKADSIARQRQDQLVQGALQRARVMTAFQQDPNNPEHNAQILARESFVQAAVRGQLDEDVALGIPAAAVEYLHLQNDVIPNLKAELAKRDEIIKQLQGSAPRKSDGNAQTARSAEPEARPGNEFLAAVKRNWPGRAS